MNYESIHSNCKALWIKSEVFELIHLHGIFRDESILESIHSKWKVVGQNSKQLHESIHMRGTSFKIIVLERFFLLKHI